MADPAVLGKLVLDAEAFVQRLFGQDSDMGTGAIFSRALDFGMTPAFVLKVWSDFWEEKRIEGFTPYGYNTGGHSAGEGFTRYLYDRAAGRKTDVKQRQIAILQAQKKAAEDAIARGELRREDTNLDNIVAMLAKLGG